MANCCNYGPNDGLVTIDFMRDLVEMTPVSGCVSVGSGDTASTQCDGTSSEENYAPKYYELSGGTFAPLRETDSSNPSLDKDGFTYEQPIFVSGDCCPVENAEEGLMKSQIGFEYTRAEDNTLSITKAPSHCDPSYTVLETRTFSRHRIISNSEDGTAIETTQPSAPNVTENHTGTLSRNVTQNGGSSWSVSFSTNRVSGNTVTQCNSVSSYTDVSLEGYSFGFSLSCPGTVPCDGGSYTIVSISGTKCGSDLSLDVSTDIEGGAGVNYDGNSISITVPRNENNQESCSITVTPTVWGQTQGSVSCSFSREPCRGWGPTVETEGCSIYDTIVYEWNSSEPPISTHNYNKESN